MPTHKDSEQKQQCAVSDVAEIPAEQTCPTSEEAWLSYWQQHGEGLLWQSWLEKQAEISSSTAQECSCSEADWETEHLKNQTEERSKADATSVSHLISSLSLLTEEVDSEDGDQQFLVCAEEPCDGRNRKRPS